MSAGSVSDSQSLLDRGRKALMANYRPAPIVLERGEGAVVHDREGRRYLDMVAGVAVSSLGHNHPRLREALQERIGKVLHTSNLYYNEPAIRLAGRLVELTSADRVFFCQSGAEAIEAALKLARRYQHDQGNGRSGFVTALQSFHGRTFGAITATGQEKYHQGFEPLVPGFRYVPYGDLEALGQTVDETTAAVMLEPIQGEGGVLVPPPGYLQAVRELCDQRGALLILDEVQTGIGRTGRFLAAEHEGVVADITTLAKGMAGGLPLGAMLAREQVAQALVPGTHASTFGGNPVCCALGLAVVETVTAPGFMDRVVEQGERIAVRLQRWCERFPVCVEGRGRGLLRGVELSAELPGFVDRAREQGVLSNVIGGRVIRLAPPLTITEAELDEGLDGLERAIEACLAG